MQSHKSPATIPPRASNLHVTDEKLSEIRLRLQPASLEFIGQQLALILAHFPNVRDDGPEGTAARAAGYVVALTGFAEETIRALHMAVLEGRHPFNPKFLPLAPEMAAFCRHREKLDRQFLDFNEKARAQVEDREAVAARRVRTPEEIARVTALAESVKRGLKVSADLDRLADAAGGNPGLPQEEI